MSAKKAVYEADSFAADLAEYIEKSGMTIQKLSAVTGLGRTAIQHTLSGKLVPAKNFIDRLCAALPMSISQKNALIEKYSREKAGDAVYHNRNRLKSIIESLPQYRITGLRHNLNIDPNFFKEKDSGSFTGILTVNNLLGAVLLSETTQEKPYIRSSVPFENESLYNMINQIFSASDKTIRLEHYFHMHACSDNEKNRNIDTLWGALKLSMCRALDYYPYYYYIGHDDENYLITPYPHFFITSERVVLLTADFSSAILIKDDELRMSFEKHCEHIKANSSLMIKQVGQSDMFGVFAENSPNYLTGIEYQPCLTGYITEDILVKRLGNVPDREFILNTVRESFFTEGEHRLDRSKFRNHFTKDGLISFAKTGKMTNMPGALLEPLSVDERIEILRKMKADADCYIMLTSDFAIPSFMQVICLFNRRVIISCLTEEKNFCCILTESGLCGAFESLAEGLADSGLTENKEITKAVIDSCIEMLSTEEQEAVSV
ncbi:MAG: helix-turn-helix transcriptional regulator [Oscillospiraceae bacterium]|nr:helix-turn-helix transcriptional regulator [Oscillospiraceae bacterium]